MKWRLQVYYIETQWHYIDKLVVVLLSALSLSLALALNQSFFGPACGTMAFSGAWKGILLKTVSRVETLKRGLFHIALGVPAGCVAILLRLCWGCLFTPPTFLLRCCYSQPYLSTLSLPLIMAVNTKSVWYHPSLKSIDQKVDQMQPEISHLTFIALVQSEGEREDNRTTTNLSI